MAKTKAKDYTKVEGTGCRIILIEAAFPLDSECHEDIERALDNLRSSGCAYITQKFLIKESFDEAEKILSNRQAL